jgi:predicted ATP-grasp superfamily ATP-dependent carboligase
MTRILVYEFLSGGGMADAPPEVQAELMPLGTAMRNAMLADLLALPQVQVSVADCAAAPLPTGRAQVQRARPGEAPFDFIAHLAAQHDLAWIVAPESDGLLARCQALVGDARWLGCNAAAIHVASSKPLTLATLQAAGVRTPLDFAQHPATRRWVVKPADGAGAVATHTYTSWAAAQAAAAQRSAQGEAVTLEPWVNGPALSISLLCPGAGQAPELLSVNTQDVRLDTLGQVSFEGVHTGGVDAADPRTPALRQLATQVASALPGLQGFAGVDLVWHAAAGPVAIEVNPRVSCAYVGLSARLGRNLAAELLALHAATHAPAQHRPESHHAPA